MKTCKWFSLFILLFCFSCGKPLPSLEGIDLHRWKEDRNACNSIRTPMRDSMDKEKNKLLALDEMQVVDLLGRPDQNELSTRNQKFYYYFLQPAPACGHATDSNSISAKLVIRFNAMGIAKEVSIE